MAAEARAAVHHDAPRWSLRLFDATAGDFAEWSEFDAEVEHLSIEVRGLSCEDMTVLIESSTLGSLPPSIAPCTGRPATSCGGAGVGAAEPLPSTADRTSHCSPGSEGIPLRRRL